MKYKPLSIYLVLSVLIGCKEDYKEKTKEVYTIYVGDDTVKVIDGQVSYSQLTDYYRHGWNDTINKVYYEDLYLKADTVFVHDTIYKNKELNINRVQTVNIDQR